MMLSGKIYIECQTLLLLVLKTIGSSSTVSNLSPICFVPLHVFSHIGKADPYKGFFKFKYNDQWRELNQIC